MSSSWLTYLPIEQHGFVLHKGAFIDALYLIYGWTPPRLHLTVFVVAIFQPLMHLAALMEHFLPSDIITSVMLF